jgi:hypothetical protein
MSKGRSDFFSLKNEIEYNIMRKTDIKSQVLKGLGFKGGNQLKIK